MRIYLDVCCFNRPFDDVSQSRVRDEADAVRNILAYADGAFLEIVGSQMMRIELKAMKDVERRRRVRALLPRNLMKLDAEIARRSHDLMMLGMKAADAVHVAAAERLRADVFITTDDRLIKLCKRNMNNLRIRVLGVLSFIKEFKDGIDH